MEGKEKKRAVFGGGGLLNRLEYTRGQRYIHSNEN